MCVTGCLFHVTQQSLEMYEPQPKSKHIQAHGGAMVEKLGVCLQAHGTNTQHSVVSIIIHQ